MGDLGFSTGIGPVDFTFQMPRLATKANMQITRALAGSTLADHRRAEDFSLFLQAPTTNVAAYYTTGYWLAVASRILGKRALATQAAGRTARGVATFSLPGASQITGSVVSILTSAAAAIRSAAGGSKPAEGVARILTDMATPGSQKVTQEIERDKARVTEGVKATAQDLVELPKKVVEALSWPAMLMRAFLGLNDPLTNLPYPWWIRWGTRGAAGTVGLLGARWYFAPQYHAAKAAWGATKKAEEPKQIENKAA
jgi:hypothetical protein